MKTLIMMVGLPRSGKSTHAKELGHPIVNPDSIRLALHGLPFLAEAEPMVWTIAKYMVASLFIAGHDFVILDSTNTTEKRRAEWIDKRWIRSFVPLDVTVEECKGRAVDTGREELLPIIDHMSKAFCFPTDLELKEWER